MFWPGFLYASTLPVFQSLRKYFSLKHGLKIFVNILTKAFERRIFNALDMTVFSYIFLYHYKRFIDITCKFCAIAFAIPLLENTSAFGPCSAGIKLSCPFSANFVTYQRELSVGESFSNLLSHPSLLLLRFLLFSLARAILT